MQIHVNPITVLKMCGETCTVQRCVGGQTQRSRQFPLGVDLLVRQSLRHEPPKPIELEHAIELVEEAVMPLAAQFAGDTELVLHGLGALLIAQSLDVGGTKQFVLKLDEVEALFGRLVSISEGRPTRQETLPGNSRFFAAMLILREFMHHLRFDHLRI
jgi:exopolyphosphatase/pppGpp-phosphohydrolase